MKHRSANERPCPASFSLLHSPVLSSVSHPVAREMLVAASSSPPIHHHHPPPSRLVLVGELVAYKLTAGTDSAVSTVFHVIRSRIIYLTTLDARSRNFYCFVTPGGVDGVEDARKLDCDVAVRLFRSPARTPLAFKSPSGQRRGWMILVVVVVLVVRSQPGDDYARMKAS